MKTPTEIVKSLSLHWDDEPGELDDVPMLINSIENHSIRAVKYIFVKSDTCHVADEMKEIIERAAQVLSILSQ